MRIQGLFAKVLIVVVMIDLMSLALPASAEIYQWRDEKGKLHVSDRPPPNVEAEAVTLAPLNIADKVEIPERPEVFDAVDEGYSPPQSPQKSEFEKACKKAQEHYVSLKWGKSHASSHTVLTRDGKIISRREQNEIAEDFRVKMKRKGCQISEKKW